MLIEGFFKDCLANGFVQIEYDQDHEFMSYTGIVKDGKFHGKGTLIQKEGNMYIGEF